MNRDFYSSKEFHDIKERINKEILRRSTFTWWNPLTTPTVGEDQSSPIAMEDPTHVDENTYTINTPSTGSVEPTRNQYYPSQGDNPVGTENLYTSASQMNVDEIKNFLVGLAKIHDINLFYGRDEIPNLAFRDPKGIEDALTSAESDHLNDLLHKTGLSATRIDPNQGIQQYQSEAYPYSTKYVTYPKENGTYVMPSGETDGEQIESTEGIGPHNFFDDYGAPVGDGNFHPYNRAWIPEIYRIWKDQGDHRDDLPTTVRMGDFPSAQFGPNPRNPDPGSPLKSRPVYGGTPGSCQTACTGLCRFTCDNECSESCTSTCWNRCGNACTATCGNVCTGCSTQCYTSCKTKCENVEGYACVRAGAKAIKVTTTGGDHGTPVEHHVSTETYSCTGCSYSCQFYPNKKTDCWDAGCMGRCFTSCNTACSTSCYGGCTDNRSQHENTYKTGHGRGCSSGCTLNCVGICQGTCEGYCISTCFHACKQQCSDNCSVTCATYCGHSCAQGCTQGCSGCSSCAGSCTGQATAHTCSGCGGQAGCTSNCKNDCNRNCIGWGCRSICGIDSAGACEANCRLNCMGTACTSICSDACSSECTTCVNTCDMNCGACSSMCSVGCESECNLNCTQNCESNCNLNCVTSCTNACGGCSNLCYSCVGMCIGSCSVRCEDGCSNCANQCSWWCDTSCNRQCFANCSEFCINTCIGSCISFLTSKTKSSLKGPVRLPTSDGYLYKYPENRWEERESFKIVTDIPRTAPYKEPEYLIKIGFDQDRQLTVTIPNPMTYLIAQSPITGGIYNINHENGEITINEEMLPGIVSTNLPNLDQGDGIFLIMITQGGHYVDDTEILVKVPFGFIVHPFIRYKDEIRIIIERDMFLLHGEEKNG